MSLSDADVDVLKTSGAVPRSPFEIQVTKEALQRRIDQGDISLDDIAVLKKAYQWMTISSALGATIGIPLFIALGRRKPPMGLAGRLAASSALSTTGMFLGFSTGGAAAALEVNKNMPDAGRKLKVFQQIVIDSKRKIEEHNMRQRGVLPADADVAIDGPASDTADRGQVWAERSERTAEGERERSVGGGGVAIGSAVEDGTRGTWDRIRASSGIAPRSKAAAAASEGSVPTGGARVGGAPRASGGGAGLGSGLSSAGRGGLGELEVRVDEGEREREQREFDALLEKERKGVDELDKWR
ncbi:hypothetical protein Q5752_003273 [Cryptotrichosporon argae]